MSTTCPSGFFLLRISLFKDDELLYDCCKSRQENFEAISYNIVAKIVQNAQLLYLQALITIHTKKFNQTPNMLQTIIIKGRPDISPADPRLYVLPITNLISGESGYPRRQDILAPYASYGFFTTDDSLICTSVTFVSPKGSSSSLFRIRFLFSRTAITAIPCSNAASVGSPTHPSGINLIHVCPPLVRRRCGGSIRNVNMSLPTVLEKKRGGRKDRHA